MYTEMYCFGFLRGESVDQGKCIKSVINRKDLKIMV